jgi:ubiquinone/menaquinone biosynthesis C-methylase UbiE
MSHQAECSTTQAPRYDIEGSRAAWDAIAAAYDRTNTPTQLWLGTEGLRRAGLRSGMHFLDVASGSGALSLPAARMGARVVAIDQSAKMLQLLTQRACSDGLDIEVHVMDGHALTFEDNRFDIAGSQFGVMLFPDMPKGVREMARVTRRGGRVLITVYGDPQRIDFFAFLLRAIQSVRPEFTGPPTDPPPLPFQLQNPRRLAEVMMAAGLTNVSVETLTETTAFRTGAELWNWLLGSNPIVEEVLSQLNVSSQERDHIQLALTRLVRERAGNDEAALLTNPINIGIGST